MTTAPIVLNVGKAVGNTASGYTEPVPQRLRPRRPREGERLRWRWEGDRRRPPMWKIELAGGRDAASWFDFLTSLPGEPEWTVTDGDQAVKLAIEQLWHNRPVHYSCEGHLKNGFLDYARADGLSPVAADALWSDAMSGVPGWWALVQRVAELPDDATGTRDWIRRNHADVLEQMGKRRPGFPRGIGALEADNERLKEWIGGRRKTFENVRRTNLTLALMRAQLAGHADPAAYTEIVRRIIPTISRTWKHGPKVVDWRRYQDRNGHKGVIEMAEDAAVRGAVALADYNVRAKRKSVASLLGEVNEYRAMIGFPPLALTPSGSAVSVKGQRLKDRPELLREWDYERNADLDPTTLRASHARFPVHWICLVDPAHRWPAIIEDRSMRLTGCPYCPKQRWIEGRFQVNSEPTVEQFVAEMPPAFLIMPAVEPPDDVTDETDDVGVELPSPINAPEIAFEGAVYWHEIHTTARHVEPPTRTSTAANRISVLVPGARHSGRPPS